MTTHIISKKISKVIKSLNYKNKIPLHEPSFDDLDKKNLSECIKSTFVSTASIIVNNFEKEICKLTKSRFAIATINGTAALQIAIKSLNLPADSEILVPNLNYIASSNAILYNNFTPHFIDSSLDDLGIDYDKLDLYLKTNFIKKKYLINKKTKKKVTAIIPTHIFGNSSKIEKLLELKKKYNLKIIEDASEAVGSFYKNKHLGTFGDIGVLSFNGNKILTTGAGGAIILKDKKIYKKAYSLCTISRKQNNNWTYDYDNLGFNFRMPGLNASIGISQMKKIKIILDKKRKLFYFFKNHFKNENEFKLIIPINEKGCNFWLNTIYLKHSTLKIRNKIIRDLNNKKIAARPVWKLMKKINYLSKYPSMNLKNSNFLEKRLINIPSSPNLI